MPRTRRSVLAATAAAIALAGCTGGGGGGGDGDDGGDGATETATATPTRTATATQTASPTEASADVTISMRNTSFETLEAEVGTGATVRWVNEDGFGHDVTATKFHDSAADWSFSESVPAGGSVTYTFEEPGVYEYYCTIHGESSMCGAVLVGDASLPGSLPCGSGGGGGGEDGDDGDDGGYY